MKVAALLLAAGAGTRMHADPRESANPRARSSSRDQNKLLLEYRGESLVARLAAAVRDSGCDELYVVVGSHSGELRQALAGQPLQIVENADWASGLASSIRTGIEAIAARRPAFDAVVLLLADQPHVTPAHIDSLLDAHLSAPDQLVASRYAGIDGVPALFPRRSFDALMKLEGDFGARSLLAAERAGAPPSDPASAPATGHSSATHQRLLVVPFEAAALDIDTPADYAALHRLERLERSDGE